MDFADKLIYVRKELKMSQEDLAKELNVSFATINRWEKRKNSPNYRTVLVFEKFCNSRDIDIKK